MVSLTNGYSKSFIKVNNYNETNYVQVLIIMFKILLTEINFTAKAVKIAYVNNAEKTSMDGVLKTEYS